MFRSHSLMSTGLKMTQQVTHQTVDMKSKRQLMFFSLQPCPFCCRRLMHNFKIWCDKCYINIVLCWWLGLYRGYEQWRYERSSRLIRNLSNCEREAWKKFRLQRDSNPWPLRYQCSALPTELWSHNCWEQVNFSGSIMPLRVIQHYSDWVCTAVMSNDVMKDLRGWYAI